MMEQKPLITIAVDGFSSSGKSTMAKKLAKTIGYAYIDSGAMYRAVTLYCLENNLFDGDRLDTEALERQLDNIRVTFGVNAEGKTETYLNGRNVETEIRQMPVSSKVSIVAAVPSVRHALVRQQQELGKGKGIVMDGRDIGTVVLPHAQVKIYLTASSMVRAKRRYDELTAKGESCDLEKIRQDIEDRDYRDMHRETSPLKQAEDAVLVDTSDMTIEQVIDRIVALIG